MKDLQQLFREAIQNNNASAVEELIKKGADIEAKNYMGRTAVFEVVKQGNIDMLRLLLKYNANVNVVDSYRNSVIEFALRESNASIVSLILQSSDKVKFEYSIIHLTNATDADINEVADVLYEYREKFLNIYAVTNFLIKAGRYEQAKLICDNFISLNSENAVDDYGYYELAKAKTTSMKLSLLLKAPLKPILDSNLSHVNVEWIENKFVIQDKVEVSKKSMFKSLGISEYVVKSLESLFGKKISIVEDITEALDSLSRTTQLEEVLDISALNFIANKELFVFSVNDMKIYTAGEEDSATGAYYSESRNEVTIVSDRSNDDLKENLIHELWHLAMYKIYKNGGKPYKTGDKVSKKAYEEAILQTLKNIYEHIHQKESPDFETNYALGKNIANDIWAIKVKPTIGLAKAIIFGEDISQICNEISFISSFLGVYEGDDYNKDDEHLEFIVRYEEQIATGVKSDKLLKIAQPLKNYIDEFTKPDMQAYIMNHPMNHLLLCPLEEGYMENIALLDPNGISVIGDLYDQIYSE